MIGALLRAHRDEGGQGLAFSALLLFVLVSFLGATLNLGAVAEARVRQQAAADAAAHSAAVVRAQALATLAAMNHVIVWTARAAAALVAAVIVLGTLVALNAVFPGAFAWAVPLFAQAVRAASEWIPRLRSWADRVAKAEDRLIQTAPFLAVGEAGRIARADGTAYALPFPPAPPLPASPERNQARFLDRVTGGLVPAWAAGRILGSGPSGYSQSHSADLGGGRTKHATKDEGNLGEGVTDQALRGKLGQFKRLLAGFARNPWPMPRVLDRRYCRESVTVASFPPEDAFQAPLWPDVFPAPRRFPFLATARPFHPDLTCPGAEEARDNLYLMEGWAAELVPVDGRALYQLQRAAGLEKMPWMEH